MCIEIFENYTSDIEQEMFDKKRILEAYDKYKDELFYRKCEMMHFTSSSMIINKESSLAEVCY